MKNINIEYNAMTNLQQIIETAFDNRSKINTSTKGEAREAVTETLNQLDSGELRICEKVDNSWKVNDWAKKAILLSFRLNDNFVSTTGDDKYSNYFDKVPLKFANWNESDFRNAGFRAVQDVLLGIVHLLVKTWF